MTAMGPGDPLHYSHCGCLEVLWLIQGQDLFRDELRTAWGKRVLVELCGDIPYW